MCYFGLLPPTVPTCYLVHQHLSDTIVLPSTAAAFEDEAAFICHLLRFCSLDACSQTIALEDGSVPARKLPKWMHETVLLSAE